MEKFVDVYAGGRLVFRIDFDLFARMLYKEAEELGPDRHRTVISFSNNRFEFIYGAVKRFVLTDDAYVKLTNYNDSSEPKIKKDGANVYLRFEDVIEKVKEVAPE